MLISDFKSPSLSLTIVSIFLGGRRGRGGFRRREGVEPRVQVELDDLPDELRRQEVRELRRQRVGESGQVAAFVVLEAKAPSGRTAIDYAYIWSTRPRFAVLCPLLLRAGSELPKDRLSQPLRENPYFSRILNAGGFKAYERAHREALTRTLSPKFALPPELVRTVVEFYLHAGFYPFTAAKVPAIAPAA